MKDNEKRGRGRPSLVGTGGATQQRPIRIPADDWQLIVDAASLDGVSAAEFIRQASIKAARRRIKQG